MYVVGDGCRGDVFCLVWKGVGWPDQSNHQYSSRRSRYIAVFNHIKNAGVTSMFESVHLIHGRISSRCGCECWMSGGEVGARGVGG